jgi:hypothetical protein
MVFTIGPQDIMCALPAGKHFLLYGRFASSSFLKSEGEEKGQLIDTALLIL